MTQKALTSLQASWEPSPSTGKALIFLRSWWTRTGSMLGVGMGNYDDHMMAGIGGCREHIDYDEYPVTHWFDEAQAVTNKDRFISKHGQELYDAVLLLKSANAL